MANNEPGYYTAHVDIMAVDVKKNSDGSFTISLQCEALSPAQQEVMRELFPHTEAQAHDLLMRERLLSSLVHR